MRNLAGSDPRTPLQGVFTEVAAYLDHVACVRSYSARIPTEHAHRIADAILNHREPPNRHNPLTDEPCGVIPTPAGLDYLKLRREQHPQATT
jgi:hypothetical protein